MGDGKEAARFGIEFLPGQNVLQTAPLLSHIPPGYPVILNKAP
jgi:hypothetical protein